MSDEQKAAKVREDRQLEREQRLDAMRRNRARARASIDALVAQMPPASLVTRREARQVEGLTRVLRRHEVSADAAPYLQDVAWSMAAELAGVEDADEGTRAAVISALRQLATDTEESVWDRLR